jgi:hypothetical protein
MVSRFVGFGDVLLGSLELQEHQRDAVDETDRVRTARVKFAGDPDLRSQEEVVQRRILPIINRTRSRLMLPSD